MSTLSTPRVVCYPSAEHALVAHLIAADEQHGTRLLIKQTRNTSAWLGDSAVMQSFRDNRLEDLARQSLAGNHTPLQGAAINAMLDNLNWTIIAEELLSHFTADRIAELDAAAVDLVAQELDEYA